MDVAEENSHGFVDSLEARNSDRLNAAGPSHTDVHYDLVGGPFAVIESDPGDCSNFSFLSSPLDCILNS